MNEKQMHDKKMEMHKDSYTRLLIMSLLSLIAMYFLMFSMVYSFDHFYNNVNKFYMAAIMTAPMVVFEILIMGAMYKNKSLNTWIILFSLAGLVLFFLFIRQQTAIGDRQFLRAMIPHHSSAILMCEEAPLEDQGIIDLCDSIVETQREEINQMKGIMDRLDAE